MSSDPAQVKVSICIGTYNRSNFLAHALQSIVTQLTDECEIVVADNASGDDTARVVAEFAERYPRIRYIKQSENLGLDRNYDTAVEQARGEYCWLFGDDDVMKDGAIRTMLDALARPYSLVLGNWDIKDVNLETTISPSSFPDLVEDRVYGPAQMDRLIEYVLPMIFIGAVVIRRQLWLDRQRSEFYGSLLIHIGVIFQRTLPGDTLLIAQPLATCRSGNSRWSSEVFDVQAKWLPTIISAAPVSEPVKTRLIRDLLKPFALLSARAMNYYSLADYRRWIRPLTRTWRERTLALAIALAPALLVNSSMVFFYTALSRHPLRSVRAEWLKTSNASFNRLASRLFQRAAAPGPT